MGKIHERASRDNRNPYRAPFASVFGIPTSTLFLTVAPEYSVIGITGIKTLGILRNSNKIMIRTLGIPRNSQKGTLGGPWDP